MSAETIAPPASPAGPEAGGRLPIPGQPEGSPVSPAPTGAAELSPLDAAQATRATAVHELQQFDDYVAGRPLSIRGQHARLALEAGVRAADARVADTKNTQSWAHVRRARPAHEPVTPTTYTSQAHWERTAATSDRQTDAADRYLTEQQALLDEFDVKHAGHALTARQQSYRDGIVHRIAEASPHADEHAARQAVEAARAQRFVRHGERHLGDSHELRLSHSSTEVEALNRDAEARVRGEAVDPRTGLTVVNGEGSNARRIRQSSEYGSPAQRSQVAEQYEHWVDEALQSGAEIAQAEVIADLQLNARDSIADLTANLIRNGATPTEAQRQATAQYARLARSQREFILENNIMTMGEYQDARARQQELRHRAVETREAADRARNKRIAAGEHPHRGVARVGGPEGPDDPTEPPAPPAPDGTGEGGRRPGEGEEANILDVNLSQLLARLPANVRAAADAVFVAKQRAETKGDWGILGRRSSKSRVALGDLHLAQDQLFRLIDGSVSHEDPDQAAAARVRMKADVATYILLSQLGEASKTGRGSRFLLRGGPIRQHMPVLSRKARTTWEPTLERANKAYNQILRLAASGRDRGNNTSDAIRSVLYGQARGVSEGNRPFRTAITPGSQVRKDRAAARDTARREKLLAGSDERVRQALGNIPMAQLTRQAQEEAERIRREAREADES